MMQELKLSLPKGKKIFFASDFHLGVPSPSDSLEREKLIVKWLQEKQTQAAAFFLVGDLFDFWYEYKHVVPRGHVRFMGKLAEIADSGIPIYVFRGNHDLWLKDYLAEELNVYMVATALLLEVEGKRFFISHGDGLGPGDRKFKFFKSIFTNRMAQWVFSWIHPNLSFAMAKRWSENSRNKCNEKEEAFAGEQEQLLQFCKNVQLPVPVDYFVFGHRHLPLEMQVSAVSTYINLGEWISQRTFAEFDGHKLVLKKYE